MTWHNYNILFFSYLHINSVHEWPRKPFFPSNFFTDLTLTVIAARTSLQLINQNCRNPKFSATYFIVK